MIIKVQMFHGKIEIRIINIKEKPYFCNFMKTQNVECIVSPANSFGVMLGGYDLSITKFFGKRDSSKIYFNLRRIRIISYFSFIIYLVNTL